MRFIAIPIAALLLGYLPGYAAGRWYRAWTGAPFAPHGQSPFAEILLSLCLSSWVGLFLAECGVFSLASVLLVCLSFTGACVGGALLRTRRRPRPPRLSPSSSRAFLAGIAITLLTGTLYSPPFETIIMASDASFYFNTGVHLARHGSISVPDPLLAELGTDEKTALFPRNLTGGYARVPGGLLLPTLDTQIVRPTFSHVLPVWIALFYEIGGLGACAFVVTVFAALSLWTIFLFAAETRGNWAAVATAALVGTGFGEFWFGRFLMPEILAQFFLGAGLLNFVLWWRRESPPPAALAALSLGIAGLTRIEYLLCIPVAVALIFALAAKRPRGTRLFAGLYGALFAHSLVHFALVPTHYRDVIGSKVLALWGTLPLPDPLGMAAGIILTAALVVLLARLPQDVRSLRVRRAAALVGVTAYGTAFVQMSEFKVPESFAWLASALSWPLLATAGIGLVLWTRESMREDGSLAIPLIFFLVAGAPFLYDPHVTPIQLWGVRRFVPVVVPFACLLAVTALDWGSRRLLPRRAVLLAVAAAGALVVMNARPVVRLYGLKLFPDQKPAVRALAEMLPPGGVALFSAPFTDVLLPLPIWLVHGHESFLLPPTLSREALRATVVALSRRHAVSYIAFGFGGHPSVEGLGFRLLETAQLQTLMPELDPTRAPTRGRPVLIPLRVYDVVVTGATELPASP